MGAVLPVLEGTRFPKSLRTVPEVPVAGDGPNKGLYVLKSAKTNRKLGKGDHLITKGPWRGMILYSLTLPERSTCWDGCQQWDNCYGNHVPFGHRFEPGPELEQALSRDMAFLARKHPEGFVVRLHILGDFYSVDYVRHWRTLLEQHPEAHVFGYTHWPPDTEIGEALTDWVASNRRVSLRRSDGDSQTDPLPVALVTEADGPGLPGTVLCPEQTGQTKSCLTCGLCMSMQAHITFRTH